jgi:hypothetical protein
MAMPTMPCSYQMSFARQGVDACACASSSSEIQSSPLFVATRVAGGAPEGKPTFTAIGDQRMAQITSEDIAYAQRIARLREFYVDFAPQLEPYLTIVRGAAAAQHLRSARPRPSGWQLFLTIAGMVALVNAVIVGATGAILIDAITDDSLGPSAVVGVPAGIVTLLFHMRYLRRSESGVDGDIRDEFAVMAAAPDPPSASSPTLS